MAEEDHLFEGGVLTAGVVHLFGLLEGVAEAGHGDGDGDACGIHVEEKLIFFVDDGVSEELVDHGDPGQRAGDQAMDHDDGDLAFFVGPQEHEVGPGHSGAGSEEACPSVSIQIST